MLRGSSLILVHIVCNISYIRTREADDKWLNTVSFEERNYITVILIYVCFVNKCVSFKPNSVAAKLPPLII